MICYVFGALELFIFFFIIVNLESIGGELSVVVGIIAGII